MSLLWSTEHTIEACPSRPKDVTSHHDTIGNGPEKPSERMRRSEKENVTDLAHHCCFSSASLEISMRSFTRLQRKPRTPSPPRTILLKMRMAFVGPSG